MFKSGQRQSTLVLQSDGKCKLGEGGRQPALRIDVDGQLVVAAAQVLHERMPSGEIEVRLSGEPAGTTIVLRLDPDGASRLAAALTHAADRTARRSAG